MPWFWRPYLAAVSLVLAVVLGAVCGPAIELALSPIRADQVVSDITRAPGRLCWRWSSRKLRPAISDNIDVFVMAGGDRSVGYVFAEQTGEPWRRSGNLEPGPHSDRYCTLLPPSVGLREPVRVEQVILYHGWHDLWTVAVRLPDVVSTPP